MEFVMPGITQARGFTLIELMIVLTLVAIVAVIAVPNFMDFIDRNRIQTQAEELRSLLLYARGEAVSHSDVIVVAQDDDQNWVVKRADEIIRQLEQNPEQAQIRSNAEEIRFRSNGSATASNFTICQDEKTEKGLFLNIQPSGAITLFKQGTQDRDGTALASCTP
ncbi:GspH/FimT family pseudopilin [Pseudomonas subflava]|uniref:GspH/FimT family pseudopilin n=1 Tax=Pseudomonas subflava TaxID=2952933 RepID=UPI002079C1CD